MHRIKDRTLTETSLTKYKQNNLQKSLKHSRSLSDMAKTTTTTTSSWVKPPPPKYLSFFKRDTSKESNNHSNLETSCKYYNISN